MKKNNADMYSFIFLSLIMGAFILFIGTEIPKWERTHRDLDRRLHKIEKPETDPVHNAMHRLIYDCEVK